MQIKKGHYYIIAVFLLLYYCYFNSLRKILIPLSGVTVPALLALSLVLILLRSNGHIKIKRGWDYIMCISWIFIAVMILFHNTSITKNLITGGMIQLYVMIAFLLCVAAEKEKWMDYWINLTKYFVLIHVIATIVFFFSPALFNKYAHFMFSGNTLLLVVRNYERGYMTGLCGHFSTNGMILGIGLLFWAESFLYQVRTSSKKFSKGAIFTFLCLILNLYALILTSKRSPLFAAAISIAIVFIIFKQKDVMKRLLILIAVCLFMYIAYRLLINYIPGLSTIMDKFSELEDSDAGVLNGRSGLWERAIKLFRANPIFGGGYGSYADYAEETSAITTSAHNYYLQILAEFGIVGLVLYIAAFVSGALLCLQKLIIVSKHNDLKYGMIMSVAMEVQLFVLFYNITATALMYYYILIPYFIACAVPRTLNIGKVR